tara:strand:+ start:301 stop:909 length:609 start_codon:yes stop_codon:yes gene_type:complete
MALSVGDDDEQPRWDLIDQLLGLDEEMLGTVIDEGPEARAAFLARISAILEGAGEAGFEDDVSLGKLLTEIEGHESLAGIEEKLPEWQSAYEVRVEKEQSERGEKLSPFQAELGSWAATAAGPSPRSMNAGLESWIRRRHIQSYLEAYVLEHRALPTGRHDLGRTPSYSRKVGTGTYSLKVGVIDFDDVARRAGDTNGDKPS